MKYKVSFSGFAYIEADSPSCGAKMEGVSDG